MTMNENSPLLNQQTKSNTQTETKGFFFFSMFQWFQVDQIWETMILAWPIMCSFLLQTSIGLVAVAFVGQIGTYELAAASLGTMLSNIMGFSVGIGFASAMDTLCSQAYGAGNLFLLGTICQRAIVILGVISIPLGLIWLYARDILILLGQEIQVATLTGLYMRYQLIGLWPQFIYTALNKYLQTQGITYPSMHVLIVVSALNPLIAYCLIYPLGWGFDGAALSVSICRILQASFLAIYIYYFKLHHKTWNGWSMECFSGWKEFLSLGLPGCIMICAEWWAAELLTLAAGWIGTESIGAQAVLSNANGLMFSIPLSISIAGGVRIGKHLGAGEPKQAQQASNAAFQLTILLMFVVSTCLICLKSYWPLIFTSDQMVYQLVKRLTPIVAVYAFIDALQIVAAGALRGCGRQSYGAICNLISYYLVGLPLSFFFAFKMKDGIDGLWYGNSIANVLQATLLIFTISIYINWKNESKLAIERTQMKKECNLIKQNSILTETMDHLPPAALTPTASRMHVESGYTGMPVEQDMNSKTKEMA